MPEREQHAPKPFSEWSALDLAVAYAAALEAHELAEIKVIPVLVKAEAPRRIERYNAGLEYIVQKGGKG